jgi:2-polyprenyl-3-methyl-5-hydroxy-6-metoxy-1,4-benzoquinol methylase
MMQRCLLCGYKKFKTVVKINNAPSSVGKLLSRQQVKNDKKTAITLMRCARCHLCQLGRKDFIEDGYYDDYQMMTSFSSQMQKYQEWLARDFVAYFGLKGKRVFEIGCGDGMFASLLNRQGSMTVGVEPSRLFYAIAKKRIKVLNQHFDDNTGLRKKHYDGFVARQVFEHLMNPSQILKNARKFLKPDGVGLIEVPCFSISVKDNRYYDIFRDHVAYYTNHTLQYLLTVNNFEVLKIFPSANNEYLTAYFKNDEHQDKDLQVFAANFTDYKKGIQALFKSYRNKNIAVWGAGGKGIALLSMCNIKPSDILFVIDSDPVKWNKYTPGSHVLVRSPFDTDFMNIDLIFISAIMYQKEIINDLRNKFGYKNRIGVMQPEPHIV